MEKGDEKILGDGMNISNNKNISEEERSFMLSALHTYHEILLENLKDLAGENRDNMLRDISIVEKMFTHFLEE